MTTILSTKYWGPYWSEDKNKVKVNTLTDFIKEVRGFFDIGVDAIAIMKDDKIIAAWIAEPGIDCDQDGMYEMKPRYTGEEYNLYRPSDRGFWGSIAYHFGHKYVPEDIGFISRKTVAI